ncbi:hypothetical protein VDG1235_3682 [Verrucomicrobiia bacterium DG1235]|nr:hypothetical protein VDG1235_3682 [Verrucomicrobiae bacterium DG1235]
MRLGGRIPKRGNRSANLGMERWKEVKIWPLDMYFWGQA